MLPDNDNGHLTDSQVSSWCTVLLGLFPMILVRLINVFNLTLSLPVDFPPRVVFVIWSCFK
jgi:hypothetical protein